MVSRIPQCCRSTEAETGFDPTSAQLFLDAEVSVLNSFLYPQAPRVSVFRSLPCSQSIRQKNSPSSFHFVF